MDIIHFIFEFMKDPLIVLMSWIHNYGFLVYAFLFLVIFVETGIVVMPLLPGDSLLFSIGLIASTTGQISIWIIIPLLILAALLGDNLNYFIGSKFGHFIQSKKRIGFLKKKHIEDTEKFFEKNGGMTIILARFVPIVRTVAPFVAGAGAMKYMMFLRNSILGAFLWVTSITLLGYFLGNIHFIRANFDKVVIAIVLISVAPIIVGYFRNRNSINA
jgi:membrane-associated protein